MAINMFESLARLNTVKYFKPSKTQIIKIELVSYLMQMSKRI